MPKLKELIGTTLKTSEQFLHKDFLQRFAKATLQDDHSLLSHTALTSLGDFEAVFKAIHIHPKHILHTRESITVFKNPIFEKAILVETKIKDLYEQQTGDRPIGFAVIEITGKQSRKPAFVCERIYAVSGGFPRS